MSRLDTSAEDLRSRFLAMARATDPYPFISTVETYLAQVPQDIPMRGLAIKALAGKGLLSVAVEVGRACPRTCPEAEQLLAATEQLAGVPHEIIPWAGGRDRFEKNLASLRSSGEPGQMLAGTLAGLWAELQKDLTLHRANDGNLLVRGTRCDGQRMWIPAALNFANGVEHVADGRSFKGSCPPPFLIDGVGMGWWLADLYRISEKTFLDYSSAIYLVETNLRALALVLQLHDWSAPLADPRVYLFVGPDAWEVWRDVMAKNPSLPPPANCTTTVRWPGQTASPSQKRLGEVVQQRQACWSELRRCAEGIYAGRDVAWWARRYATADAEDPLRVLCITSRFTSFLKYSMRDTVDALERAGLVTRLLIEPADHLALGPHDYLAAFIEFQPDLVLIIDHHRHEQPHAFISNVPFACWIQDPLPHLMCRRAAEPLGPLDFTFGFYKGRCEKEFGYPPDRFFSAPIPVSHTMFSEQPVEEQEAQRLACDVIYVGHLNETIDALRSRWRSEQPRAMHPILDRIDRFVDEVLGRGEHLREHYSGDDPTALVRRLAGEDGNRLTPESAENLFSFYTYRAFDVGFRLQTLRWVAQWARQTGLVFKLYGKGWQDVSELAPFAAGPIDHGDPLRKAYRCARLAIQTMPAGFKHQRSLEAIASGCLVLCRYVATDFGGLDLAEARRRRQAGETLPAAAGVFAQLDQVSFRNPEELASLGQRFLENRESYNLTLGDFRQRVFGEFSYDTVISRVIGQTSDALRQQADRRATQTF
jgi:hypothetical protein